MARISPIRTRACSSARINSSRRRRRFGRGFSAPRSGTSFEVIANARMYSVNAEAGADWRELLSGIIAQAGVPVAVIDYPPPAPLEDLWSRTDQAAVFMCGLPYSRAQPQPVLIAAPI